MKMKNVQAEKTVGAGKAHKVLVIDVGGTNIKMLVTGEKEARKIPSGPTMTAVKMARVVKEVVKDWDFDRVSLGYPGPIINGHPLREPHNLGRGWMKFDFSKAFGCPVKVINDAAMQALGSYKGGCMLFLGLGTGLGSAMIVNGTLEPMELAHLAYKKGKTYEDYLGLRGLEGMGKKKWRKCVAKVTEKLKGALEADYVVLGGTGVRAIAPLLGVAGMLAAVLGGTFGLYALLTRERRRAMREIRRGAEVRGWRYQLRRWQGNPAAFRIEGATHSSLGWEMTSGNTRGYDKGWSIVLGLRVPMLGGEVDLAMLPRGSGHGLTVGGVISPKVEARLAAFSGAIASGMEFFQNAEERPSGLAEFDAAYEVLVLGKQFGQPPVDVSLGREILSWPAGAIAPRSVLAWRDPFGFHVQARLPGPANWNTVCYLTSLAEAMCARVPAPVSSAVPLTFVDRAIARILEP
jgi:hypothetical protein